MAKHRKADPGDLDRLYSASVLCLVIDHKALDQSFAIGFGTEDINPIGQVSGIQVEVVVASFVFALDDLQDLLTGQVVEANRSVSVLGQVEADFSPVAGGIGHDQQGVFSSDKFFSDGGIALLQGTDDLAIARHDQVEVFESECWIRIRRNVDFQTDGDQLGS